MTSTVRSVSDVAARVANRTKGHTDPASHDAPPASRSTTEISLRQAAPAEQVESGLTIVSTSDL